MTGAVGLLLQCLYFQLDQWKDKYGKMAFIDPYLAQLVMDIAHEQLGELLAQPIGVLQASLQVRARPESSGV